MSKKSEVSFEYRNRAGKIIREYSGTKGNGTPHTLREIFAGGGRSYGYRLMAGFSRLWRDTAETGKREPHRRTKLQWRQNLTHQPLDEQVNMDIEIETLFTRRCADHPTLILDDDRCPNGHRCDRWYVVNERTKEALFLATSLGAQEVDSPNAWLLHAGLSPSAAHR